ncbi:MAG: hypothetical protein JRJ58_22135, partial [Deltaproteobacteria bacterium]|nr:hypothetical protein [Deltaproteobacteria bacterium]
GRRGLVIESDGDGSGAGAGASADGTEKESAESPEKVDYDRDLGVIEAITDVTRSCPSGVVVTAAKRALEAIGTGGADVMKQQAYFVLSAIQGWRGDRARQVHRSLTNYLAEGGDPKQDSTKL